MSGHVIAITGGKGGVGKSTTTINLGVSLRIDGYSVVLVDADVEMPNLDEMLSLTADRSIHDVLSGEVETAEALVEIGNGFAAMPGNSSLESYGKIEPERLNEVVGTLTEQFDYVILDTGAGLSYDDLFPIGLADRILLVTSPDPAAIENTARTKEFVNRLNREVNGVVVTKVGDSFDRSLLDKLDTEVLGVIPEDPAVRQSTELGEPLEVHAPDSPSAEAYRRLEANLTDGVLPPKRSDVEKSEEQEAEEDAEEAEEQEEEDLESEESQEEQIAEQEEEVSKPGLFTRIKRLVMG